MSTVIEIEDAIEKLPQEKKLQLRHWVIENIPTENDDIIAPTTYRQKVLDALEES
ncbi:MAG: hypothetical protein ABI042_16150 [Verrucomicrobiota bacterium]